MIRLHTIAVTIYCLSVLLAPSRSPASTLTTLTSITGTGDGASPAASMIVVKNILYGVAEDGGATGSGALFKLDPATGVETILSSFTAYADGANPVGGLLDVSGVLYGTTYYGGTSNAGTVFKLDLASGTRTVVCSFAGSAGANPAATLIDAGGTLYGTTQFGGASGNGEVFALDPATGVKTIVYSFAGGQDGSQPYGGLLDLHGTLYGTTVYGGSAGLGTVFKLDPVHGTEAVLHSFAGGSDGSEPASQLIELASTLYGTTSLGGPSADGTVFTYSLKTRKEAVLHSFTGTDGSYPYAALIDVGGMLYGTTPGGGSGAGGTVFSIDPASGVLTVVHDFSGGTDGIGPYAGLVPSGNTLYGAAEYGGLNNQGAIFSIAAASGQEAVTYSFTGSTPVEGAGVIAVKGTLLATASDAGASGFGSVVSVDPASGTVAPVYAFSGNATGTIPIGTSADLGGFLYGATLSGGGSGCNAIGCGTIYKIDAATGAQTVIHSFGVNQTNDGALPETPPIAVGSVLYGTTLIGGDPTCQCGTVYSVNIKTGQETVLYRFLGGSDGEEPFGGLVSAGGKLYGTTIAGGAGAGTLFSIDIKSGAEAVLYRFSGGADGAYPYTSLIDVAGVFYGTTYYGGASSNGTVFKFDPASATEMVLHSFAGGGDGANPATTLFNLKGKLYGATTYGGVGGYGCYYVCGTIFMVDAKSGVEALVHTFAGSLDGGNMFGAPMVAIGGTLYGATGSAGGAGIGTVFKLVP